MVKPILTTLLLCEKVLTDAQTRANTLINVFNQLTIMHYPVQLRGCVFAVLTDGKGTVPFKIQSRRLDSTGYSNTVHVITEGSISFEDPLRPAQITVDFNTIVEEPGVFAVEMFVGDEYLSSIKLSIISAQHKMF